MSETKHKPNCRGVCICDLLERCDGCKQDKLIFARTYKDRLSLCADCYVLYLRDELVIAQNRKVASDE